jgi:hypothetical protein
MTKLIRVDAEAEDEIAHAIAHCDDERGGLGAEFWDDLSSALQTLEAPGPECGFVLGLPRDLGVRRKLLLRFPSQPRLASPAAAARSARHAARYSIRGYDWRRSVGVP